MVNSFSRSIIAPPRVYTTGPAADHAHPVTMSDVVVPIANSFTTSSVPASRIFAVLSPLAVRICALSGLHAAAYTEPFATTFSMTREPSLPSKIATSLSDDAEKKREPSGEKRTQLTNWVCFFVVLSNLNGGPW